MLAWVNGVATENAPVSDRGFQYGDGVFTTLPLRGGQPIQWTRHLHRLARDCLQLGIPFPDSNDLIADLRSACSVGLDGILKIQITAGSGGRGYRRDEAGAVSRILTLHPPAIFPSEYAESGVVVRLCRLRLGISPALAGAKHMNRLEQVLARGEWQDPSIAEGLMFDAEGMLVEGTLSNVYCVKAGRIATPRLDRCGVSGVTRQRIFDAARAMDLAIEETRVSPEALAQADEVFLSNSVIGVWPVRACDQWRYRVGPIARRMADFLDNEPDSPLP